MNKKQKKTLAKAVAAAPVPLEMRLNRFIAQSGVCARREADVYIERGDVRVNGKVVTEMGMRVNTREDEVTVNGRVVLPEKPIYILLNKPKNHLTTVSDPEGRRTVMDLIGPTLPHRVYPVGRLDRNTTGILLLTNDGDLAEAMSHPRFSIPKGYRVSLDRKLTEPDFRRLMEGVELEDGPIRADKIYYVDDSPLNMVYIEVHSGRNRIVRRMFEALGYRVVLLDRVRYGPLQKKGIPRGKWRFLTDAEVGMLRMSQAAAARKVRPRG